MKRTILALAIAGLSFSASALPPPGSAPPLNVTVTNPSLDVSVTGQPLSVMPIEPYTELSKLPATPLLSLSTGPDDITSDWHQISVDSILQGFYLDLDATSSTKDGRSCIAKLKIVNGAESQWVIHESLVQSGARDGNYVPLPNIFLPADSVLEFTIENSGDQDCKGQVTFHYVFQ